MSDLDVWLVIVLLTVATVLARSSFLLLGNRVNLPPRVQNALRYAPACALAALIAPDILMADGHIVTTVLNPKLLATALAVGFFLLRKDMLQTIFFGMIVFTLLRLIF